MANGPGPDLGAARAYAERAGLRLEIFDTLPRLAGMVTADDDVILLADGVLPDRGVLVTELDQRYGVLAFPEDPALELGFERLDATHAWSGALRTRGDSVARLADLPDDCDLASSLLRIALQSGARVVELDPAMLVDGMWKRRVDRAVVAEAERSWIARQIWPASFAAPGTALVERIAMRLARDAGGGRWARAPHLLALGGGGLGVLSLLLGWPVAGLFGLLCGSIGLVAAQVYERVEALGAVPRKRWPLLAIGGWLRDGLLVALLAKLVVTVPGWLSLALPLALVGVVRLGEGSASPRVRAALSDRIVLLFIVIAAAIPGWSTIFVPAILLVCVAALLWSVHSSRTRITPN